MARAFYETNAVDRALLKIYIIDTTFSVHELAALLHVPRWIVRVTVARMRRQGLLNGARLPRGFTTERDRISAKDGLPRRWCPKCERWRKLDRYRKDASRRLGYEYVCRDCKGVRQLR